MDEMTLTREEILHERESHKNGYGVDDRKFYAMCDLALSALEAAPQPVAWFDLITEHDGSTQYIQVPDEAVDKDSIQLFAAPPSFQQATKCLYGESIGMPDHACRLGCDYDEAEIASRIKSAERQAIEMAAKHSSRGYRCVEVAITELPKDGPQEGEITSVANFTGNPSSMKYMHPAPPVGQPEAGTHWLIFFDDADRRPEVWTDEAAARKRYTDISYSWNAHLFVKVDSNSRDATRSDAAEPAAKDEAREQRIVTAYCAANDYINAMLNPQVSKESLDKISAVYWQRVKEV